MGKATGPTPMSNISCLFCDDGVTNVKHERWMLNTMMMTMIRKFMIGYETRLVMKHDRLDWLYDWIGYETIGLVMKRLDWLWNDWIGYETIGLVMKRLDWLWNDWIGYETIGLVMKRLDWLWNDWIGYETIGLVMKRLDWLWKVTKQDSDDQKFLNMFS